MGKVCQKFNRVFRFTTVITLGLAASFSAAQEPVEAPFNGVSLSVQSPTVPPAVRCKSRFSSPNRIRS